MLYLVYSSRRERRFMSKNRNRTRRIYGIILTSFIIIWIGSVSLQMLSNRHNAWIASEMILQQLESEIPGALSWYFHSHDPDLYKFFLLLCCFSDNWISASIFPPAVYFFIAIFFCCFSRLHCLQLLYPAYLLNFFVNHSVYHLAYTGVNKNCKQGLKNLFFIKWRFCMFRQFMKFFFIRYPAPSSLYAIFRKSVGRYFLPAGNTVVHDIIDFL